MGRMESKSTIGVKYYDVLSKKTFGDIAALDRRLPLYSFENPFNNKISSSTEENAITAEATRSAELQSFKIDVIQQRNKKL